MYDDYKKTILLVEFFFEHHSRVQMNGVLIHTVSNCKPTNNPVVKSSFTINKKMLVIQYEQVK